VNNLAKTTKSIIRYPNLASNKYFCARLPTIGSKVQVIEASELLVSKELLRSSELA